MKKVLASVASVAMFLSAAAPVAAMEINKVNVVGNDVEVGANSGYNVQSATLRTTAGGVFGPAVVGNSGSVNQGMVTGPAAASGIQSIYTSVDKGCNLCNGHSFEYNKVNVIGNDLSVGADSGENGQIADLRTRALMTGPALVGNSGSVNQGMVTGPAAASGSQWVVTKVDVSSWPFPSLH